MKNYSPFLKVFLLLMLAATVGCNDDDDIMSKEILVAAAGDDKVAKVNDEISFDGSASYAKDNKTFHHQWAVTAKPHGSAANFENSTAIKPTFKPDKAGLYIIQLRIVRDHLFSTDDLKLTVTDDPESPTTIILSEDISENATLYDIFEDPSNADYRVVADIAVRANLTIMPGVTVAFEENTGLEIVTGSIQSKGLGDQRITFRGVSDQPGFWKGIVIHTNSDLNKLEFTTVTQGGSSVLTPSGIRANVTLAGSSTSGAAANIAHSSFSQSGGYGLYLQGMSSLNDFENNLFENNASAAYVPASQLHRLDRVSFLDISDNLQTVETGGMVASSGEFSWENLPYLVSTDITIKAGISIEPGAHFKFEEGITVNVTDNGYLYAAGTNASRITFTSADPNIHWNGLYFNSYNQRNTILFSDISNGGRSRIADADHEANVVIGHNGMLAIENSILKDGLGFGIPQITGVWLDRWSFNQNKDDIASNLYDRNSATWFDGAANPWAMPGASFGIRIEENGQFIWTIAEHSPMTGCESYSAEFITGQTIVSAESIAFQQDYWRSKFVNKCDETQNVDTDVTPSEFLLPYTINKMYNVVTGEQYWELKMTNPDNSTFSLYRRFKI
jgi:hypothetical protein